MSNYTRAYTVEKIGAGHSRSKHPYLEWMLFCPVRGFHPTRFSSEAAAIKKMLILNGTVQS